MLRRSGGDVWFMLVLVALCATAASAQQPGRKDAAIEQIRTRRDLSATDTRQIGDWVNARVRTLKENSDAGNPSPLVPFLKRFTEQYSNRKNTPNFKTELVLQTSTVARTKFAQANVSTPVARGLATVLVDFNRIEAVDALLAGLSVNDASTRGLCLAGLTELRSAIERDAAKLPQVVQALRRAGASETDSGAAAQIYRALAYENQTALVFDAYLEILDKRLAGRGGPAVFLPYAEVEFVEFFRLRAVINALSQPQKTQLVGSLAVLLRSDAQRYGEEKLKDFYEKDALERRLHGIEAILVTVVGGGNGGRIRAEIEAAGHEQRAQILKEAYKWVGDAAAQTPGALNAAPWNVPIGAP